ncbi:MAG: SBBP repeat-containing protein [Bacteroidota bacterium]
MTKLIALLSLVLFVNISYSQNFSWVTSIGGKKYESYSKTTADAMGNVFVAGSFQDTVSFNTTSAGTLTFIGKSSDIYLSKFDHTGACVWAKHIKGKGAERVGSVTLDSLGNVYLGGIFDDTTDFDPGIGIVNLYSKGTNDGFIAKFDIAGNLIWVKQIGGTMRDDVNEITLDKEGNVYATGLFQGTCDFDPSAIQVYNLTSPSSTWDGFILKLDPNGIFIWAKKFGTASNDYGQALAIDKTKNIIIVGEYQGGWRIILKLDSVGNQIWLKQTLNGTGYSVKVDQNNNVYTAGYYGSSIGFINKIDTAGNILWTKYMGGGSGSVTCWEVETDLLSNVYVCGHFTGSVDMDPGIGVFNLIQTSTSNGFAAKYDPYGNFIWAKQLNGSGWNAQSAMYGIKVNSNNDVFLTGKYEYTVDFDPSAAIHQLNSAGYTDAFILKLTQDSCSNLTIVLDSVSSITCTFPQGYAYSHAINGVAPYNYNWSTTPAITNSTASFSSSGIYTLSVSDSKTCQTSTAILVNGFGIQSAFDLSANLISNPFRPGVYSTFHLDALNNGCTAVSGQIKLILDSALTFNNSTLPPNVVSGDTLVWNFSNLNYDAPHILSYISVTTSTLAAIGNNIHLKTIITPITGDFDTLNNIKDYYFPIVNSYDPNDKKVYPSGVCPEKYVLNDKPLTYTIRFQNTGTASAINILVTDSLDSDLDINSLKILSASHYMFTEIAAGNVLKFHFKNIYLPDSSYNEQLSHGYLIYEIQPKPNLPALTKIINGANIYFDYNIPVITNRTMNTVINTMPVVCGSTSMQEFQNMGLIKLYPNPSSGLAFIEFENEQQHVNVEIFNTFGQIIYQSSQKNILRLPLILDKANGIYFAKIMDEMDRQYILKIIIE